MEAGWLGVPKLDRRAFPSALLASKEADPPRQTQTSGVP